MEISNKMVIKYTVWRSWCTFS